MNPMYYTFDNVKYKFTFHPVGWSYAEVRIRIKSKFLGIPYWKCIWSTSDGFDRLGPALAHQVLNANKRNIQGWCESALGEYLSYKKSWED